MLPARADLRYVSIEIKVKGERCDVEAATHWLAGLFSFEGEAYFYHSSPTHGWTKLNATFRPAAQFYTPRHTAAPARSVAILPYAASPSADAQPAARKLETEELPAVRVEQPAPQVRKPHPHRPPHRRQRYDPTAALKGNMRPTA